MVFRLPEPSEGCTWIIRGLYLNCGPCLNRPWTVLEPSVPELECGDLLAGSLVPFRGRTADWCHRRQVGRWVTGMLTMACQASSSYCQEGEGGSV